MQINHSGRKPRENNMSNHFSTRVPVSSFTQASGNSEWCNMTGKEDNVGFLATGSGVKQFQLSLWGCFMPAPGSAKTVTSRQLQIIERKRLNQRHTKAQL
jgi:hypothetical protein